MRSLADQIEQYIKELLRGNRRGDIEVRRSELAHLFECAPSQINYVLSTRFTTAHGYYVESRRGGGGFLRIIRLPLSRDQKLLQLIDRTAQTLVSQPVGEGLIQRLEEEGFLTPREAILIQAMTSQETLPLEVHQQGEKIRAHLLRAVLLTVFKNEFAG
jgi:transcriptional regulator CtsR